MPFMVFASFMLMTAILSKMMGTWPVSPSHRELIDSMVEEHPDLDDSVYQTLRFKGAYFSEGDRDMILDYWILKGRQQQEKEAVE